MSMVFSSPSLYHFTQYQPLLQKPLFFSYKITQKKCELGDRRRDCLCDSSPKIGLPNGFSRRDLGLFGLSSSLSLVFLSPRSNSEENVKMVSFVDETNAYTYSYPLELPSKKFFFKCNGAKSDEFFPCWVEERCFILFQVESRKPERYSSAAPLSPDARLRIVSERVGFADNLIISVTIGPPNSQFLKSNDKSTWNAKDVADSVLSDKSALRVTSSQRLAESSILDTHSSEIDGEPYWYYEYLVRKSPTKTSQESNLFRHYVTSTAERDGYLYSLTASTLGKQWDKMGPALEEVVSSFRLLPPTESYVSPTKDPWRFW